MKKFIIAFLMMLCVSFSYAQQPAVQITKLYDYPNAYIEFGIGAMIPTDNSNEYTSFQFEIGKYINPIFGLGIEFQSGSESEYHDHLSYMGINTRYKLNPLYNTDKMINFEAFAGIGYGWYSYITDYSYDYYYYSYNEYRTKYSYIVPKFGINAYVNIGNNFYIGLCPEFAWYISTNKDNSSNVGVFNVFAKLKYNF